MLEKSIRNTTFIVVLRAIKAGRVATREAWNNNSFTYLSEGSTTSTYPEYRIPKELEELAKEFSDIGVPIKGHIDKFSPDGIILGWTPTTEDVIAEDWCLLY